MSGVEAGVDAGQLDEAAEQQAGPDEQHDGERRLGHDQARAKPVAAGRTAPAATAVANALHEPLAGGLERRSGAEHQAGDDGEGEREERDREVDADRVETRDVGRPRPDQQLRAPVRHDQSERAACDTEHHRLGQQLPHEPTPAGADRRPNGQFALS